MASTKMLNNLIVNQFVSGYPVPAELYRKTFGEYAFTRLYVRINLLSQQLCQKHEQSCYDSSIVWSGTDARAMQAMEDWLMASDYLLPEWASQAPDREYVNFSM